MTPLLLLILAIAPPGTVTAFDAPDDGGGAVIVTWELSPDDAMLDGYEIRRSEDQAVYVKVGFVGRGRTRYGDDTENGVAYTYQVVAIQDTLMACSPVSSAVTSSPQWLDRTKLSTIVALIVLGAIILYFIARAKRGKDFFIRPIAGLQAVDEAVGRATEMGKPILYSLGLGYIENIATIASLNILGEVAKKCATYDTKLIVPNYDPIVYTVAREIVKEAYTKMGRPDAFNQDSVYFLTDSQFAYAAAVDGIMVRERPATNFLIGWFYAESLIMAETGASTGAIQIAGTDALSQLPFFVTACDYTLIGEELYAASAYISKEPMLVSAIKGEDWGKIVIAGTLIIGSLIGFFVTDAILRIFG